MSVIAGVVSKDRDDLLREFRERFESYSILPEDRPADYVLDSSGGERSAIALKYKPVFPLPPALAEDDRGNVLATLGYWRVDRGRAAAGEMLERCCEDGAGALEACEGEFISVFLDAASRRIHIVNDRFGSRPLYWTETPDRIVFASNLPLLCRLAGGRQVPDPLGWLQIASFSHTLGTRTIWTGVHRMRPGTHLVLGLDGISERQYWRLVHAPSPDLEPVDHARQAFAAFLESTRRRSQLASAGIVALSGGLDSRLVVASLPERSGFSAYTFTDWDGGRLSADVKVARQVCTILNVPHHVEAIPQTALSTMADEIVGLSGGLLPLHHPVGAMRYIEFMRQRGRYKLGSGVGDVLAGSYVHSPLSLDPALTDRMIRDYARVRNCAPERSLLAHVFNDDVLDAYAPQIESSFLESFEAISGPTAAHRTTAWAMAVRQPAFTCTSPLYTHPDVTETIPFLDYAYCDLMLQLPAPWLYKRNFYAFMIHQCLPELRRVRYANTGRRLSGVLETYSGPWRRERLRIRVREALSARAALTLRKAKRRLRREPSSATFHLALMLRDQKLLEEVETMLGDLPALLLLVDAGRSRRFLANLRAGRPVAPRSLDEANLLGSLASMCHAIKLWG